MYSDLTIIKYNIETPILRSTYKCVNYLIQITNLYDLIDLSKEYTKYQLEHFDFNHSFIEKIYRTNKVGVPELFRNKIISLCVQLEQLRNLKEFKRKNLFEITFELNKKIVFNIFSKQVIHESYWKKFLLCSR